MSNYVTKEVLDITIRSQTDEIVGIMQSFMQQIDDRFTKIETDINQLKESHDRLINTIDRFISRIDKY